MTKSTLEFRQWLELKFLEWQRNQGGRKTVLQFADYLGVSQQTVSSWWNSPKIPQGDNIRKLADKLGLEVYNVLGLERPDRPHHPGGGEHPHHMAGITSRGGSTLGKVIRHRLVEGLKKTAH